MLSDLVETASTASVYGRTFDVSELTCFLGDSCSVMRT